MFKFVDTDSRAISSDVKAIDESIQLALKASVPGLVVLQNAEHTVSTTSAGASLVEDRYTVTEKHRTLIPPNAFNVSTLFQPTLAFIEKASETAPAGFEEEPRAFGGVLEDFVVKVFLPQLDEKVTASFQQAVSGEGRLN
jgi:exocyst complex component 4